MTRSAGAVASRAAGAGDGGPSDAESADARVWMQAARAWVIERHPYLDVALTSMILVARPGMGTVAVDARWRLYYDPARVLELQRAHGIQALAGDWVHEVMHLLRDHPDRWESLRDAPSRHRVFNLAADALVNTDVADLRLPLLETDVTFATLPPAAGCTRSMATEEIYSRLLATMPPAAASNPSEGHDGSAIQAEAGEMGELDCGSGAGGPQRSWEEPLTDGPDDGSPDSARADIIREETAHQVRESARRGIGTIPRGMRVWADALLDPVVDWRRELRSVVSRRIGRAAGVTDYAFTRLARRRVPGFTLPGMVGAAPPRIAAVIDTSGSMGRDDLAQCLGDLLGLSRAVSADGTGITVVTCDADARRIGVVRTPAQVRGIPLRGGGGTDMTVGIEECALMRPRPEVVVVLTDGYTPWPPRAPAGLESATVIALLTTPEAAAAVPRWIRTIAVEGASRA